MVAESAEFPSERRLPRGSCYEQRDLGDAAIVNCREPGLYSAQDARMGRENGKCRWISMKSTDANLLQVRIG